MEKLRLPKIQELRPHLTLSVGAVILAYIIISTAQAIWQNYQLNKELTRLREEHGELTVHNKYLNSLISYRKTESFKDKQAREKLNYQKPGETVFIVPQGDIERFTEGNIRRQPDGDEIDREPSNPEKWWDYFFG